MELSTRPLAADDAGAALALLSAYDRRFFGEPMFTLADLESGWRAPGFSFVGDTEAYVEDDVLVAFSTLDERGGIELAVAADWSGSGLDVALLTQQEQAAARRDLPSVHRYVHDHDLEGAATLEARGYRRHHTAWILGLAEDAEIVTRVLPPGYAVRPMTEADTVAVHAVVTEAFGEWGGAARSYAAWRAELVDRPDVTLEHGRVVTRSGALVGACLVLDPDPREPAARPEAWVAQLAVRPAHRHRGLAQQMLAETYLAARARGLPLGGLSTDDRTGALGLYERLGMRVRHAVRCYQLELGGRADG